MRQRLFVIGIAGSLLVAAGCSSATGGSSTGDAGGDATKAGDSGPVVDSGGQGPDGGADASSPEASTDAAPHDGGADAHDAAVEASPEASTDGSSEASTDASTDSGASDAAGDEDAPDPCGTAPTTTFYVNAATGSDTNNGAAPGCAFKTITAALAASSGTPSVNATIHLAAGAYGAGETFPLVVDHGRSLVGAGAATTTIQGSSAASYNTSGTGSLLDTGTHFVTLRAGDAVGGADNLGATTLSGFTVLPAAAVTTPTTNYLGIVCIAGNAPNTGATLPLPSPSLVVQGVTVGPNFDTGVVLGSQPTQQIACNALVTASTITGCNVGLATGACGTANPVSSWPSSQIGDGQAADANTFSASTIDLFGEGCGSLQSFDGNHFTSGYRGIVLVSPAAQYFEILHDTFDGTSGALPMGIGIHTNSAATISKLNDDTFTNIAQSAAADAAAGVTSGYAMRLGGPVKQAQRNAIHDNDNGISLDAVPAATFDFSSGGTAANTNQIYCNSKPAGGAGSGYDLVLQYAAGSSPNFAGNTWDHATPSTSASLTTSANGTDVVTGTSTGATVTGGVAVGAVTCAGGRVQ